MANRRMLSKSISVSEKVDKLSDFAALLFTWMIPHADDWGVIPGSPKKLKGLVMPYRERQISDINDALNEMKDAGLIWRYEVQGEQYIQFCKWEKHQEGLHKRTKPKMPLYPGNSEKQNDVSETFPEVPGNSGSREQNRIEENRIDDDNARAEIIAAIQQIKPISDFKDSDKVNSLMDNYPRDWLLEAIKIAVDNKAYSFGFIETTVYNWRSKGHKDTDKPWEVEKNGRNHQPGNSGYSKQSQRGSRGSPAKSADWEHEPDTL